MAAGRFPRAPRLTAAPANGRPARQRPPCQRRGPAQPPPRLQRAETSTSTSTSTRPRLAPPPPLRPARVSREIGSDTRAQFEAGGAGAAAVAGARAAAGGGRFPVAAPAAGAGGEERLGWAGLG